MNSPNRPRPWHIRVVILVGLLAGGCGQQPPVHAVIEASQPPRQIRVNGIATLEVNPDVVDLTMTLSITRERPKAAVSELRDQQGPLVAALVKAGVDEPELRLSYINVMPHNKPYPDSHIVDGYSASITLVASLRDFARIGDVMEAAASHGVSQLYTRFRSTKMTEKKKEAREMALQATRDKAQQIATSMHVELGNVLAVEEVAGNATSWGAVSNENVYAVAAQGEKLQPGAIELSLTLEVAYELE